MTLVKRDYRLSDPFSEMDRFFDRSFMDSGFWPGLFSLTNKDGFGKGFPVNVYGDDESYYLVAELPGVRKEDIDLKLENAMVEISAKRIVGEEDSTREINLTRSITIGDDVNADAVTAKLENGVLTVTLPKAEERKPRTIAIG